MKKIVLAGGTGNLGKLLTPAFVKMGYAVVILSRSAHSLPDKNVTVVEWDGATLGAWQEALEGADAVINLSGKSIQCRFTETNKKELMRSRILPTQLLGKCISQLKKAPRLWINFSGISIFEGVSKLSNEDSKEYGTGFLAILSSEWEKVFFAADTPYTKKVCLRISPVLSNNFGMFKELHALAKMGLAGKVGDGRQCVAWVHEQDFVRLVCWIIGHKSPSSLYHACTIEPVTNEFFMKTLRKTIGVSFGMPMPVFFTKLGAYLKGIESSVLLDTIKTTTTKTVEEGFQFAYPTLESALGQLVKTT